MTSLLRWSLSARGELTFSATLRSREPSLAVRIVSTEYVLVNFLARMPAAIDCFRMIVLTVLNFLPYLMTSCPFSTVGFCARMRAWERFFPKLTG